MTPAMMNQSKPKGMTFKLPSGYKSDDDSEVKEALLKFKEGDDGICEMISLDGAPFKAGGDGEDPSQTTEMEEHAGGEEDSMPEDMEGAIAVLQKRDRKR